MKLLFLGDVVGKPGRRILAERLGPLQREWQVDFTVVNGENSAGGRGITPAMADEILALGVDVITSGNHIWAQGSIEGYLRTETRLLRPDNYPSPAAGSGLFLGRSRRGLEVAVVNLQGRVFMPALDCPFQAVDRILDEIADRARIVVIDMHAEATSEKLSMGWYCDGRATAVLGTHTHVPTADARILPGGTAFCTDVGMTGPYDSVIGTRPDLAIERLLNGRPIRFQVANGNRCVAGVVVEADPETGHALAIHQVIDPPLTGSP
ncbi:MAG TPA: TIGR00282 family metallophosphoesterase [Acidobacteriota bacterium]|nr:TIGR00282 family metallophosphoesterase [Acidobacteriota bacterium]